MRLIILAAGRSSRMGEPKGLVTIGGLTLLEKLCAAFWAAGGREPRVVLGGDAATYRARFPLLPCVVNPNEDSTPFESLQIGLRKWPQPDWTFVTPVDVPCFDPDIWRKMIAARREGIWLVQPTYADRGGHPVLLSPSFVSHLLTLTTLTTLGAIADASRLDLQIRALDPERVRRVVCTQPDVTLNLNSPEDLAQFTGLRARALHPPGSF